jgi:hypothetical protein
MNAIAAATLFREPPPTASGQRQTILRLLREAARFGQGVSGDTLRRAHGIPQAPARVWELKNLYGFQIETRQDRATRMATYFFRSDPPAGWRPPEKQARLPLKAEAKPGLATREGGPGDWFTRATGKPRQAEPTPYLGPLFETVTDD